MGEKIQELKKQFSVLQKKYSLPSYVELNEEFDIQKIAEQETETLAREIRKTMMDKAISYLRFVELLLNPTNAPMFFFALLKGLTASDRKILEEVYGKLGKLELGVIRLDNNYSEKNEAEFVNKIFKEWKEIKNSINTLFDSLESCWDKKCEKRDKSYLG